MALKNISSEGYIQFPVLLSKPDSCSLFAGRARASGAEWEDGVAPGALGSARGIVLTSLSVPRRSWESIPALDFFEGDWSSCEESQPSAWSGVAGGGNEGLTVGCAVGWV